MNIVCELCLNQQVSPIGVMQLRSQLESSFTAHRQLNDGEANAFRLLTRLKRCHDLRPEFGLFDHVDQFVALDRSTRAPSLPSLGALCELFVIRPIVQNLLGKL